MDNMKPEGPRVDMPGSMTGLVDLELTMLGEIRKKLDIVMSRTKPMHCVERPICSHAQTEVQLQGIMLLDIHKPVLVRMEEIDYALQDLLGLLALESDAETMNGQEVPSSRLRPEPSHPCTVGGPATGAGGSM